MTNYFTTITHKIKKNEQLQLNDVLIAFKTLRRVPGGLSFLSKIISRVAPYFKTVDPIIKSLDTRMCTATMKKRKAVENHIGTVHVIAICNGLEFVMGVLAEASVPRHLRWLPKGMQVNYLAKSNSDIKLTAIIEDDWKVGDFEIRVQAHRSDGVLVVDGKITLWVTENH